MKFISLFITALIFLSACHDADKKIVEQKPSIKDGLYVGLEEKCWYDSTGKKSCYNDPAEPARKYYNLTQLKIKGDSVFADQSTVGILGTDTMFSASDGGFYYHRGTITKNDSAWVIRLTEVYCDYCGVPVKKMPDGSKKIVPRKKIWEARAEKEGFRINGYLFIPHPDEPLDSELRTYEGN